MTQYRLYLESGPRQKTTMVHVLDILGCFAQGKTIAEALAATTQAIQSYLTFLRRHGEDIPDHSDSISLVTAEHITKGFWLGRGSPSIAFHPEQDPISAQEMSRYLRWLDWAREDMLELVQGMSSEDLNAPSPGARALKEILEHVWQTEQWYVKNLGPLPRARRCRDIFEKLEIVRQITHQRLGNLSDEERAGVFYAPGPFNPQGDPWTARKSIRRCLEHQWEHLNEIAQRVAGPLPDSSTIPS